MQTETISIKLPTELNNLLEKVAKREDRSKSSLMRIAIQEYLEDIEDARVGEAVLAKLKRGQGKLISFEEIKKEMNYVED